MSSDSRAASLVLAYYRNGPLFGLHMCSQADCDLLQTQFGDSLHPIAGPRALAAYATLQACLAPFADHDDVFMPPGCSHIGNFDLDYWLRALRHAHADDASDSSAGADSSEEDSDAARDRAALLGDDDGSGGESDEDEDDASESVGFDGEDGVVTSDSSEHATSSDEHVVLRTRPPAPASLGGRVGKSFHMAAIKASARPRASPVPVPPTRKRRIVDEDGDDDARAAATAVAEVE